MSHKGRCFRDRRRTKRRKDKQLKATMQRLLLVPPPEVVKILGKPLRRI